VEITILRHGKPDPISDHLMTASEFIHWIALYDQSKVSINTLPLPSSVTYANNCDVIICSGLQRSIDSATILNGKKIVLCDALFKEAGLPSAGGKIIKMSPKAWSVLFRVLWFFGYSTNSESFEAAKKRASLATDKLVELAGKHGHVLFVGHGIFNRLLIKALIKRGWSSTSAHQSKYWAGSQYKKN